MDKCELRFFHGFLGSPEDWDPLIAHLPKSVSCSMGSLTQDNALDKPTILVGYSMGGRAAIATALAYPQHVQALFLLSCNLGLSSTQARAERRQEERRWLQHIETKGLTSFLTWWYTRPLFAGLDSETLVAKRARLNTTIIRQMLAHHSIAVTPNYWEKLSAINASLFFLFGGCDTKYRAMSMRCGGLPKAFAAQATHAIHLEAPQFCANYITQRIPLGYHYDDMERCYNL